MSDASPPAPETDAHTGLAGELRQLRSAFEDLSARLDAETERSKAHEGLIMRVLNVIHDDDQGNRRRLASLRSQESYRHPFLAEDPLVSVVIPTWNNVETLIQRSLPSALGQTHQNIEVIVIGDASPPEIAAAVAELRDPRVRFHNLTVRGPYDEDPRRAWLASGTPGLNAGVERARGLWIAPLADDDAFVPDHIERLLAAARERDLEFVYGRIRYTFPNGETGEIGVFPPRVAQFGLQASIYHSGLSFLQLELGHALFDKPNDWGFVDRLLRIGVRLGMVEEISVDYWPSMRALEGQNDPLPLRDAVAEERRRADELNEQLADLSRRFEEVRRSRSWRMTAPLRRLRPRS
jgi:hypothetical protein